MTVEVYIYNGEGKLKNIGIYNQTKVYTINIYINTPHGRYNNMYVCMYLPYLRRSHSSPFAALAQIQGKLRYLVVSRGEEE